MTYEYLCATCQHAWEEEQSISAPPTETCPSCGQPSAKRQVSGGVGFILKGGGWYADGYGSGSAKKSDETSATDGKKAGDAKSSTAETAKSTSTKSESSSSDSKSGDSAKGDSGKGGGASGASAASPPA